MQLTLESKAFRFALLAASLSLAGAGLLAGAIKKSGGSSPGFAMTSSGTPAVEVVATPQIINEGRGFFEMSCAQCHGDDAHGDEGPDLHHLAISNSRIAATIKKGIKGEMPTFAKKYDARQVAALVSYLRTLR